MTNEQKKELMDLIEEYSLLSIEEGQLIDGEDSAFNLARKSRKEKFDEIQDIFSKL